MPSPAAQKKSSTLIKTYHILTSWLGVANVENVQKINISHPPRPNSSEPHEKKKTADDDH